MPILGVIDSSKRVSTDTGAYFFINSTRTTATTASVVFNSIPQTYTHLQLRISARTNRNAALDGVEILVNGNTYNIETDVQGTSSGVTPGSNNVASGLVCGNTATSNYYGICIADLYEYTSTIKTKPIKSFWGYYTPADNRIGMTSAFYSTTSAVTSLTIRPSTGSSWLTDTVISLYGVKS